MPAKMSVATIDAPEFINIHSVNPKISKCEIKVLYIGANRNRSFISKEVALEMAQTLPGVPIVGHYIKDKEDFGDHGQQVIIDDEGIKFNTLTTPYGFIAPDAKIWFQKFEETDELGNTEIREYLMAEGYLWTAQFKECQRVVDQGNWQSMELDENSLQGNWSIDYNSGIEFFIINDAIFSKLCILGEDVEPCFEGANITAPDLSTQFSQNKDFHRTLYTMMKELNEALKGEEKMPNPENIEVSEVSEVSTEFEKNQDNVVETEFTENDNNVESISENSEISLEEAPTVEFSTEEESPAQEEAVVEETPAEVEAEVPAADFAKEKEEEKEEENTSKESDKEESKSEEKEKDSEDEDEDAKKKYSLLEDEYTTLKNQYAELEVKYQALVDFRNKVEEKEKDDLINSFSMLDENEKKEVVDNKSKYSLDEIESKLSVLFTRKQMKAAQEEVKTVEVEETVVEETPVVYSLHEDLSNVPDWVKATLETQKNL